MNINLCDAIQCPFANVHPTPPKSSGCTRYGTSWHCHLKAAHKGQIEANEYWLFGEFSEDEVRSLKAENDTYIAQDESSQRQLEMEAKFS